MIETLTQSIQDYLKHIFELTEHGTPASTTALASHLGIAPASVTGMVQKLANAHPPLLDYRKHQGVTLTPDGKRAALEVIRHHRLLETWLVETLGYTWDEVHEEACRLEHVISEDFETRMDAALGHPERDPHGAPIPTPELVMPVLNDTPLSELRSGQKSTVRRVLDANSDLLRHIDNLGIHPGVQLEILDYSAFDQNLYLRVASSENTLVLGQAITNQIFVEVTP